MHHYILRSITVNWLIQNITTNITKREQTVSETGLAEIRKKSCVCDVANKISTKPTNAEWKRTIPIPTDSIHSIYTASTGQLSKFKCPIHGVTRIHGKIERKTLNIHTHTHTHAIFIESTQTDVLPLHQDCSFIEFISTKFLVRIYIYMTLCKQIGLSMLQMSIVWKRIR